MPRPTGDVLKRHQAASGGARGNRPIKPMLPGEWRVGMPCHWTEQTRFLYWKSRVTRFFVLLNLAAGIAYLIFRGMFTIGKFTVHPALIGYQIFFMVLEVISVLSIVFRIFELWNIANRNSVDFKRIPNELLRTNFAYPRTDYVPEQYSNYPSVGVFIPCYNEDADLVLETVLGALAIDYPKELLQIYLCDDGKDDAKKSMIEQLRYQHNNVFYVVRPDNSHAKAGNLNYSLERTKCDLIVTLDADFIARPNLLQRMISYYYVWNPDSGLYEFNELLAVVQTPQHFRNLSPYDADPLDQRGTLFADVIMPGKDYWNASTMIGTTNLLSRVPLAEAGYYPYHSITEDSAMSLAFHALGYRTYYLNESLATGLATTSLHSNIGQRSRWLKGDYQIFFNWKYSPMTRRGLSPVQRFLYLNMTFGRLVSIAHFFYDIIVVLLLVFAVSPIDAPNPLMFLCFFGGYIVSGVVLRFVSVFGGPGLGKSEAGSVALEAIFRYPTIKGLFAALIFGQKLKFKVTDKAKVTAASSAAAEFRAQRLPDRADEPGAAPEAADVAAPARAAGVNDFESGLASGAAGAEPDVVVASSVEDPDSRLSVDSDISEHSSGSDEEFKPVKYFKKTKEERQERRVDVRKNLKRLWFNILFAEVLVFSIVWAFFFPPINVHTGLPRTQVSEAQRDSAYLQISMAVGFALVNLLPHLMAIYLCFVPYVSGWMMTDLVHGRCDQYAVHPKTGKLFVPRSFISLLSLVKAIIMVGAVSALAVFVFLR